MPRSRTPLSPLCAFGHVATHAELLEAFHGQESAITPFRMTTALCTRLRMGVYVCTHLTERERTAALCGGQLDCLTVLSELGLPVDDRDQVHLRLPRGHGGAAERKHRYAPLARVHWSRLRTPIPSATDARWAARTGDAPDRLRVPLREALRQAMTSCLSYADSGTVLEAMLAAGHAASDLAHAIEVAPRRVSVALRQLGAIPRSVQDALDDSFARQNRF